MKEKEAISSFLAANIKHLRKQGGFTLEEMAEKLGLKGKTSFRAYEEGRALPNIHKLMSLASLFNVSLEDIIYKDLSIAQDEVIRHSFDVELVPVKAAAGYTAGFSQERFTDFQLIGIPYQPPAGIVRAFEIEGDSMIPMVQDKAIVVANKLSSLNEVQDKGIYIVVTKDEGIVLKAVTKMENSLLLTSLNPNYMPYVVQGEDIHEVWKYFCHIDKKS